MLMKIATPTNDDIDLSCEMYQHLQGSLGDYSEIDEDNFADLQEFYRKTKEIYNRIPSALLRVVFGLALINDDGFIDQGADTLTLVIPNGKK